MAKDKEYIRMVHTGKWLRLRRAKLTSNPICERCRAEGRITPSQEVHHIKPVEDGLAAREKETLMYDAHNLQALCHDCHVKAHTELGRSGKVHAKRRAKEHLRNFVKKFLA